MRNLPDILQINLKHSINTVFVASSRMLQTENVPISANQERIAVHVPMNVLATAKKEFKLSDKDIDNFVSSAIERAIAEHINQNDSTVFTEAETKELEDDLKGLGYI